MITLTTSTEIQLRHYSVSFTSAITSITITLRHTSDIAYLLFTLSSLGYASSNTPSMVAISSNNPGGHRWKIESAENARPLARLRIWICRAYVIAGARPQLINYYTCIIARIAQRPPTTWVVQSTIGPTAREWFASRAQDLYNSRRLNEDLSRHAREKRLTHFIDILGKSTLRVNNISHREIIPWEKQMVNFVGILVISGTSTISSFLLFWPIFLTKKFRGKLLINIINYYHTDITVALLPQK